jgi:hypothetical protein
MDVTKADIYKIESDFSKFFELRRKSARRDANGKWIWDAEHAKSLSAYCVCRNPELGLIKSQLGCWDPHCSCICWDHNNHGPKGPRKCTWPGHAAIKKLVRVIKRKGKTGSS